ncbi:MAG: CHASE3 domain-containing protein [Verrucomicrobiota bacterium]
MIGTTAAVVVIVFLVGAFLLYAWRNHQNDAARAHTVEVMRSSSVLENDLAALEAHNRGLLLTGDSHFAELFRIRRDLVKRRLHDLGALVSENKAQAERVRKAQEVTLRWLDAPPLLFPANGVITTTQLGSSAVNEARETLQTLQKEEQIVLNKRMREQDWATQSTQILDFVPRLERSVIEMDKEKRGYLLTSDNGFIDAYRKALTDFYTYHGYVSILVATDPQQASLLGDIKGKVERWVNESAAPEIDAKRRGTSAGATLTKGAGEQWMQEIERLLGEFQRNELAFYEARSQTVAHDRIFKTAVVTFLALFAVSLLIASNSYGFVLVRRQLNKLAGAEVRITAVIENILDGMITVDSSGTIRSMNPAAESMFACGHDEMVGQKFITLVPKAYQLHGAPPEPMSWDSLAERTGTTVLALGRTRLHTTFPIEFSLSQMQVNRETTYIAMIRDVTERKRFEQEIAADKESLAVTLRSIGDGVITTDVQGKVIMINHAAEVLTGWSSAEAIGQPLQEVFSISIDLAAQARAHRGHANGAHSILLNLPQNATLKARDKSERLVEQVASPIRDNKKGVTGVVLVFRDITEREHNASERRKAESLEQLGLLAGGIAHDFNNLLTAIMGNISLASLMLPAQSEMTSRLNDAKNASMRARDLAQQLLTFARGGAPIKKTASIGKLIQDTVSFSLRGSQNRSEFKLSPDLWQADVDSGQISQVVANLVVNADQAMPNGGTLHVSCENLSYGSGREASVPDLSAGNYVRIAIRDEGMGIPENYLKRIFDPYFTTKAKGNGLGLATTYSIIKNHKGLITVESEVNRGSTFSIYLPAAECVAVAEEAPRASGTSLNGTGRILVVDDEEAIRALVEFTLSHLGYEVQGAESALAGVDLYRDHLTKGERFDLVILDLTLPGGMGGKEALKHLIEIDPSVNAVVSSGYATDATMSRYEDFGFRGVIAKPYEAADLGRIVKDVIASDHHTNVVPERELETAAAG